MPESPCAVSPRWGSFYFPQLTHRLRGGLTSGRASGARTLVRSSVCSPYGGLLRPMQQTIDSENPMSKTTHSINSPSAPKTNWPDYIYDFPQAGHQTVDWIARDLHTVSQSPVLHQVKPGQLFDSLPEPAPVQGESFAAILLDLHQPVLP